MKKNNDEIIEIITSTIKAWTVAGVHPQTISTALNNAFLHGEAFDKGDFICNYKVLGEIYEAIDALAKATSKVK